MKDISTVRRQPQRLWEWARIAAEEVEHVCAYGPDVVHRESDSG